MIGRSFFLLSLLQAVMSGEWTADIPPAVTAQNGLCARIPCRYWYPMDQKDKLRTEIWFNSDYMNNQSVAFHSADPSQVSTKFQHRTRLSGVLSDGNCSLVIDNVTLLDAGPYCFRVEFGGGGKYTYPATQLRVIDFTDKPTIFPAEMVAGQPVNVTCSFNTTCNGTAPTLTWGTPTDQPPSASHSVTERGDTLIYTSVLSLTPAPKHHGQNLTCRVRYPTVSSEQKLTLTVQYAPQNLSITSPHNVNSSWVSVKERNSAAILCSVHSFPASNLTWGHLGVTMNTTPSSNELWMEFPQLMLRDAGVYQCVAQNEHGTAERDVTLTVEYAPQNFSITSPNNVNNSTASVKEGISAAFLCSVQSFPASNLTWRHRGVTLNTTSSSNELWLKILRVTTQDAGDYQCVAENEHGAGEGTMTLMSLRTSMRSQSFRIWIVVCLSIMLTVVIILIAELAGFLIYKYIKRREDVTSEKASGNQDTNVTHCPHCTTNQRAGSGEDGPAPGELEGEGEAGEGGEQEAVYSNLQEVPRSRDIVHSGEEVEYADLWFQSKQGKG
ncbi:sialic acid-binding Ig-like lectin 13 [Rhinoraja longicauda]